MDSPFALPLSVTCAACGREEEVFSGEGWEILRAPGVESPPREAYRCRACRRSVVELVIGIAGLETSTDSCVERSSEAKFSEAAVDVVARCQACRSEARIARIDHRPTDQEVRLDFLYGRR